MRRTLVVLRKSAILTAVFAFGYYKGHYHAMTNPDDVRFRRVRKESMEREEERRQEKIRRQYQK